MLGACAVPTAPLAPAEEPTPSVPAPSIEPAPAVTDEEEVVTEEEEKVAPAAEQAEPTPTPTPAPTTVPTIRDFDIYPEDKVAIERGEADIELNRKGDVLLTVTDSRGRPAPGLSVKYQLVKHSFLFGVFEQWPKPIYNERVKKRDEKVIKLLTDAGISYSTLHLNWRTVEPQEGLYTFDLLDQQFQPLYSKDFRLRGHALLFHKHTMTPEYVRALSFDKYKAAVYQHVFDTVSHFKETIERWDAINSPTVAGVMRFSEAQTIEIIQVAIQAIRDAQPNAQIFINIRHDPASEREYTFLSKLNEAEVAYDIVGLQMYYNGYTKDFTHSRLTLAQIGEVIDHYSTLGKEIHITEFSVPSAHLEGREGYWGEDWDEDLQAAYLKAAYTIFFSKPKVQSITWWNASDFGGAFIYNGGLASETFQPKKAYYALKDLIKSWTTTGTGVTDEKGQVSFRGFGGTYEVTISDPKTGLSKKQEVTVEEQRDNLITIVLD